MKLHEAQKSRSPGAYRGFNGAMLKACNRQVNMAAPGGVLDGDRPKARAPGLRLGQPRRRALQPGLTIWSTVTHQGDDSKSIVHEVRRLIVRSPHA
jgi:hypothetical protein